MLNEIRGATTSADERRDGETREGEWSFAKLAAFRFGMVFIVLRTFPGPFDPFDLHFKTLTLFKGPVAWLTLQTLGAERVAARIPGEGDRLGDWVLTALLAGIAAIATAIWSSADRRTNGYPRLAGWTVAYLRLFLSATLLGYGVIKLYGAQFTPPDASEMIRPMGQMAPMGLLWNTMGTSKLYQVFGGAIECGAATMLLFRRTALIGALLTAAVMANVLALNFGFDINVKQFSLHLLAYALVIVFFERRRLVAFVVGNRAAPPVAPRLRFASIRVDRAVRIAAAAFTLVVVWSVIGRTRAIAAMNLAPMPAWSGLYEVTAFAIDGREVPPTFGDRQRWRRATLYPGAMVVELGDDARETWLFERDDASRTLKMRFDDRVDVMAPLDAEAFSVSFDDRELDVFGIDGTLRGHHVIASMRRIRPDFRLDRPTGHWVDDGSFQR